MMPEENSKGDIIYPEWQHKSNILTLYYCLIEKFSDLYKMKLYDADDFVKYNNFLISLSELYNIIYPDVKEYTKAEIERLYDISQSQEKLTFEQIKKLIQEISLFLKELKITKLGFYNENGLDKIKKKYNLRGEDESS